MRSLTLIESKFMYDQIAVEGQSLITTSITDAVSTTTTAFFNSLPTVLGLFGLLVALGLLIRFFVKRIGRKA